MIGERELWSCADLVLKQHGDRTAQFLAGRVADLAAKGDREGIATWMAIAERVDALQDVEGKAQPRH